MRAGLSPRRSACRRTNSEIDTSGTVTSGLLLFTIIEGSLAGSRAHASPQYRGICPRAGQKLESGRGRALPRERPVDDGVVGQDHPLPEARGEKGQPAARRVERSRGRVHAEWAAPAVPSRTASRHSRFKGRMGGMGTTVGSGVAGATASLRSVAAPFFMNRL